MKLRPKDKTVLFLIFLIVILSLIDVFANALSLIPVIGPLLETLQETLNETLQIILASLAGVLAVKR